MVQNAMTMFVAGFHKALVDEAGMAMSVRFSFALQVSRFIRANFRF